MQTRTLTVISLDKMFQFCVTFTYHKYEYEIPWCYIKLCPLGLL